MEITIALLVLISFLLWKILNKPTPSRSDDWFVSVWFSNLQGGDESKISMGITFVPITGWRHSFGKAIPVLPNRKDITGEYFLDKGDTHHFGYVMRDGIALHANDLSDCDFWDRLAGQAVARKNIYLHRVPDTYKQKINDFVKEARANA